MKTGLTKKQKVTEVYYNAKDPIAEVYTHDTKLKKNDCWPMLPNSRNCASRPMMTSKVDCGLRLIKAESASDWRRRIAMSDELHPAETQKAFINNNRGYEKREWISSTPVTRPPTVLRLCWLAGEVLNTLVHIRCESSIFGLITSETHVIFSTKCLPPHRHWLVLRIWYNNVKFWRIGGHTECIYTKLLSIIINGISLVAKSDK